jgi:hypothetical protein
MAEQNQDYVLTLFEACEFLSKSSRTISRYIRKGVLRPVAIRSRQGTLEYRFSRAELEAIKKQDDMLRQVEFGSGQPSYGMSGNAQFANASYAPPYAPPYAQFVPNVQFQPNIVADPTDDKKNAAQDRDKNDNKLRHDTAEPVAQDESIISLLKGTTEMLRGQLKVKDEQIKGLSDKIDQLIERGRETNILLKGMQDKMLRLEQPAAAREEAVQTEKAQEPAAVPVEPIAEPISAVLAPLENKIIDQPVAKPKPKRRAEKKSAENIVEQKQQKKNFFSNFFS